MNPVPCIQCGGTWADPSGATWTLSSSGDNVTGSVSVSPSSGCQPVTYSVSGSLTRIYGGTNFGASTSIVLNASNPAPTSSCGVPATATMTYTGSLQNDGCDKTAGTWQNADGNTGAFTMTKPFDVVSSETTTSAGWSAEYPTVHQWRQYLSGPQDLTGRQVKEGTGFGNTDSCYFDGSPVPPFHLSGGGWNVGFYVNNQWADDYVGRSPDIITYYRQVFRTPCDATASQIMYIYTNGNSGQTSLYLITNTGFAIPNLQQITSSRDGNSATTQWP